jgi:uncharacterized membrane protein YjgN (DUF898 family)
MTAIDATSTAVPDDGVPPASERVDARFVGEEPAFWRLLVRGAVLLLVTLGIYRFWLVTDVRRYLWVHSEVLGDGLEYVGTARELLLGFLIAITLLVPMNVLFFLGAFGRGVIGQIAGVGALAVLALLGQFAVYRARRYRLSRTVYRGLRFHQTGSAWRYAVCALFWWAMIALTFGLAYPFAQASLERFKLGNTYYGDLKGRFEGSGWRLFFRGLIMWMLVIGPFLFGVVFALDMVDWAALGEALQRGDDVSGRLESARVDVAAGLAVLALGWSVLAAAVLYPLFQAMVLRWWISGLRFGTLNVASRLRTGSVYGLYMRFLWLALLLSIALGVAVLGGLLILGSLESWFGKSKITELLTTVIIVGAYVVVALSYSTVYQATVKLRLWKLGFESLTLSGTEVLDGVHAAGAAGSAVGEGLADALNVGGM